LTDTSKEIEYFSRKIETERSPVHFGQLKLFAMELKFLTKYVAHIGKRTNGLVVYAGAASGYHINFLAKSFPNLHFHLYDPKPFCESLTVVESNDWDTAFTAQNWKIFEELFTEETALRYKDKPFAFISDIRSRKDDEIFVEADMTRQMEWIKVMQPDLSMVKFRLPWQDGFTHYLSGEIWLQAFAPLTTTETRLVIDKASLTEKDYDNRKYERQMSYHNCINRIYTYDHGVRGVPGMDNCFDCSLLVSIVTDYFNLYGFNTEKVKITKYINSAIDSFGLGKNISTSLDKSYSKRTKSTPASQTSPWARINKD
jgi:cap2 methyltransferase